MLSQLATGQGRIAKKVLLGKFGKRAQRKERLLLSITCQHPTSELEGAKKRSVLPKGFYCRTPREVLYMTIGPPRE